MATQRLEKWLETANHEAAQDLTFGFDLADSGCALDVSQGRDTHEANRNPLNGDPVRHDLSLEASRSREIRGITDFPRGGASGRSTF